MNMSTSPLTTDHRIWLRVVQKSHYRVGTARVTCTLYRVRQGRRTVGYALRATDNHGQYLYPVGRSHASAQALFAMIVRHAVAPCTLGDILADMAASKGRF